MKKTVKIETKKVSETTKTKQVEKTKFVGVVKKSFTKKDKLYKKGTSYDALNKDSLDYLINIGLLEA